MVIVGHIEAGVFVLAQELYQLLAVYGSLVGIGISVFSLTDLCKAGCSGILSKHFLKLIIATEEQVHLIREILDIGLTRSIGRHDVNIEISLRLCRAPLSRKPHEEIAFAEDIMGLPIQVVLIDFKVSHILLGIPFKAGIDHLVEIGVKLRLRHHGSLLLDLLVVVHDLVDVDVILIVGVVEDNELSRDSGHDRLQRGIDRAEQEVRILLRHRQEQTKIILQVFCRHTKLDIKTVCGQTMHAQGIDDLNRQRLIRRFREGSVDNVLQLLACIDYPTDGHVALQEAIGLDCRPIVVKRDDARCVFRYVGIKNLPDAGRDILQDVPVFNQINPVKHIDVGRMDREQIHKLLQPGGHAGIQVCELLQMFPD